MTNLSHSAELDDSATDFEQDGFIQNYRMSGIREERGIADADLVCSCRFIWRCRVIARVLNLMVSCNPWIGPFLFSWGAHRSGFVSLASRHRDFWIGSQNFYRGFQNLRSDDQIRVLLCTTFFSPACCDHVSNKLKANHQRLIVQREHDRLP